MAASLPSAVPAQEAEPAPEAEAVIERILELEAELERLLSRLSPEARAELAERRRSEDPAPPPAAVAPEAPPEPPARRPEEPVPPSAGPPEPETFFEGPPAEPRCGTLEILDSNGDGVISGVDRDWRYLSLWRDDGDDAIAESEVKSLYEHGVRRVAARLSSYTTAKDVDGGVWIENGISFDLPGRRGQARLVIDATRLARGERLWLEHADGRQAQGIVQLDRDLVWVSAAGERLPVLCR